MNYTALIGRLTRSPEFKDGEHPYTRITLAVDRIKEGTDFINCIAFGKTAESLTKWCGKGTKIAVEGRIQTGSYENREGKKVNTFDVIINNWEFAQSKGGEQTESPQPNDDGFATVPDSLSDDGLPFI